ncbi:enoyl-CoA hydratase-related protein [Nocardia vaccinii]|uniref:enoyl-CoA hydratase-related protein n=1 Tax=Nocardia vaccinii TaxID=1822 RepID=UPI00082AE5DB|nr:enoyl-CoA hydratase-related protein [Nocardia vaccinii]
MEYIKVERRDHLLVVTLDRPEVLNALHAPANAELSKVFDDFGNDPDLWVAVLTGSGRAFCVGNDLKYQAMGGDRSMFPASGFGGLAERWDLTKPVIAAVNGMALGGGLEIALACDIIIADEDARFGLPEVKVGVVALGGGLHRLPRAVGLKRAMALALTGDQLTARQAMDLGFVSDIAPRGETLEVALRWADRLLACAPLSLRATKQAMLDGYEAGGVRGAMEARYSETTKLLRSEDFREGARAFAEKRKPVWKAR